MPDRVGQSLGNYRLVRLLGRGGFAEVYLAEHRRLGTQAAIKVLYTHISESEEETFLAEARTIAYLEHPHIVRILDFDVQEGTPFLVMGYAPNGTLRQRHPKGTRLPIPIVLDYLKQITSALQYAHDEKVIHRDIKPENILLGRHNELFLSDFGIALIAQSSRMQSTQDIVGTASYMAPEQLQGKPCLASDQYSLAVVVYEWLTGDRPFHGTFVELYSQHLSVPPPSLRSKASTLSPELDQVVLAALAKDPTQRFASVKAFTTAFEQATSGSSSQVHPFQSNAAAVTPPVPAKDAPLPSAPLPAATVTPPDAIAITSDPLPPTPTILPAKPASMVRPPTPTLPDPPRWQDITSSRLARSNSYISRRETIIGLTTLVLLGGGICILASRSSDSGLTNQPLTDQALTDQAQNITVVTDASSYQGHSNVVSTVAWSSDSKRIASGSFDTTVQVWNAADGGAALTYKGHSANINAVAWSPDGKHIASGSADNTVQVWNATNGRPLLNYEGHTGSVNAVAWSPDGKWLASASDDYTVRVWEGPSL